MAKGKRHTNGNSHLRNSGYSDAGASTKKRALRGFTATSDSASEDINDNNQLLRQRARSLYMSAPVATSAIRTNRTNVVGTGLKLQSRVDADVLGWTQEQASAWQRQVEREFELWANDKRACDATGVNDFYSMQQLVLTSWLLSGDVFALVKQKETTILRPYGLRLHIIEADRVSTPFGTGSVNPLAITTGKNPESDNPVYDGVEVDKDGAIEAYHVCNSYMNANFTASTEWVRIEAYGESTELPNILHVMDSERPEQYRGVSYLAQIIEPLLQLRRYSESELTAAIVTSFLTAWIKTAGGDDADDDLYDEDKPDGDEEVIHNESEHEFGPGQVNELLPGEEVEVTDPKRPAAGFKGFVEAICMEMGAALELPVDLLLKKFDSSYSASRAALEEAWKAFKMRRIWLISDFCAPTFEIWLSEAIARGRVFAPGFFTNPIMRSAYLGSAWTGPSKGQLDPLKEVNAEILMVEHGFTTREQATLRLTGDNYESNAKKLTEENQVLAEANLPLEIVPGHTEIIEEDIDGQSKTQVV